MENRGNTYLGGAVADQYAEFRVNNVTRSVAIAAIEQINAIPGADIIGCDWDPISRILRVGVGGENLATFRTNLLAAIQARFGKTPDLDRFATNPDDMDPKNRVITGRDRRSGVAK